MTFDTKLIDKVVEHLDDAVAQGDVDRAQKWVYILHGLLAEQRQSSDLK